MNSHTVFKLKIKNQDSTESDIGVAWLNTEGTISIKLRLGIVLQCRDNLILEKVS